MITVNNVSMKFDLGIERDNSFKQVFINILSMKKKEKRLLLGFKRCIISR